MLQTPPDELYRRWIPGEWTIAGHAAWWGGHFSDNPVRRRLDAPVRIIGPYVKRGMTVMDVGGGMGLVRFPSRRLLGTAMVETNIDYYQANAKPWKRMDRMIERMGVVQMEETLPGKATVSHGPVGSAERRVVSEKRFPRSRVASECRKCVGRRFPDLE